MSKHGKAYADAKQRFDRSREYTPSEAIALVKQLGSAKFPEREAASKELDAIGEQARSEVQRAVERALAAPRPDPATVLEYVYRAPALAGIPG